MCGDRHGKLIYLANDGRTATATLYGWTREAPLITPYFRLEAGQDLRLADLLRNLVVVCIGVVRVVVSAHGLKHRGHRQRDPERLRQPRRAADCPSSRCPWPLAEKRRRQKRAPNPLRPPQAQALRILCV